jgi:hypothetical protein
MVNYCLALPILPGKGIELVKKFAQEHGGHTKEHDEFYRIAGISREQVWIQRSPPGSGAPDLEIVSIERRIILQIHSKSLQLQTIHGL